MKTEVSGDLALAIAVPINSLDDLLVPFACIVQNTPDEDCFQRRPIGEPLALRDLGNMVTLAEMIGVPGDKIIVSQEYLAFDVRPDGSLADAPGDELAVFFCRLGSRSTELAENPVRCQAGMRLFPPGSRQIAGPFPLARQFHHVGAYRVQNSIAADFQQMCVFLN